MSDWIHLAHEYPLAAIFTWVAVWICINDGGQRIIEAIRAWKGKK